jgi:transposase, IS5 family
MDNLVDFALKEKYEQVSKLKSRLDDMNHLIDWTAFVKLFPEKETTRGRPEYDKVLMIKILCLQSWYTISDEEAEFQITDRLSFQKFLGYPKKVPDYSTIWRFREELTEDETIDKIWSELHKQINALNLVVKEGKIQDASFIDASPGKTNSGMNNRGREAKTSRSKDGSWTKKSGRSHFGFKLHTKMQRGSKIIEEIAVTTARVFDGHIDLAKPDEIMYRDRGYSGTHTKAKGDATMKKGKLNIKQKMRNKRISKKRSEGEHPYGTIHKDFKGGTTKLTTIARVFVQQIFVGIAYNIKRLKFLLSDSAKKIM